MQVERNEGDDEADTEGSSTDSPATNDEADVAPLTAEQKQVHLRTAASCCPGCGSDQIEGDSFDVESGVVSQQVRCLDCDRRWCDVYRLADVQG